MKVYWSGAALALMADIKLRQRSDGEESIDTVLSQLQVCCLPSKRQWSGSGLFKKLDSFLESPVFMPLYRRYANEDGFPDTAPILNDLGIEITATGVVFDDGKRLSAMRRAID